MSNSQYSLFQNISNNFILTTKLSVDIPAVAAGLANFLFVVGLPVATPAITIYGLSSFLGVPAIYGASLATIGGLFGMSKTLQTKSNTNSNSWDDAADVFFGTFSLLSFDRFLGEKLALTSYSDEYLSEKNRGQGISYSSIYLNVLSNLFDSSINMIALTLAVTASAVNFLLPTLATSAVASGLSYLITNSPVVSLYAATSAFVLGIISSVNDDGLIQSSKDLYNNVYDALPKFNSGA